MKKIWLLVLTFLATVTIVYGQNELCLSNIDKNSVSSFGFRFSRLPANAQIPSIYYSLDADKWTLVKKDGLYDFYIGTDHYYNVTMVDFPHIKYGDVIYLRSNYLTTNSPMLWGSGVKKIFVSGDFNSMSYVYHGKSVDKTQWDTFFYGDVTKTNPSALKDYVYGIDMSSYDPVHDMFKD